MCYLMAQTEMILAYLYLESFMVKILVFHYTKCPFIGFLECYSMQLILKIVCYHENCLALDYTFQDVELMSSLNAVNCFLSSVPL